MTNVLLIGSGGREHALAWSLAKSPLLGELYCAPSNAGIKKIAKDIAINIGDHDSVVAACRDNAIELVIIGPEVPLVAGLADDLEAAGIKAFGPSKAASQLEGSKGFTKDLCREAGIPTAAYGRFSEAASAKAYLDGQSFPIVVKADGLAAGKGVIIAQSRQDAEAAIDDCFSGRFGAAGAELVIEEFLTGEEASVFVLVDGENILPLATAQDHKRVGEGDTGPNTGGMGAYSPAPIMTIPVLDQTMSKIIKPTVAAMKERGTPYKGVLYAGLMIEHGEPKLIEYNVRFGDPECQVLMMRLKSDLLPALLATCDGVLSNIDLRWHKDAALTVVMAAEGYPGTPLKGTEIKGLDGANGVEGVEVFHAGTKMDGTKLVANGGRVLNVTALGKDVSEAKLRAYQAVDLMDWPQGFCRRDIGWRAIAREHQDGV